MHGLSKVALSSCAIVLSLHNNNDKADLEFSDYRPPGHTQRDPWMRTMSADPQELPAAERQAAHG